MVLTDFGTASERKNAETFCGSPNYMAPEIVNHLPYTKAVDWWSCGCIIYNMVTGQPPFKSQTREELFKRILSYPLEWPTKVSKPCAGRLLCVPTMPWDTAADTSKGNGYWDLLAPPNTHAGSTSS